MTREPRRGKWMMPLLSDFLGVSGEALRILDGADPADRWLLIRRLAEYEIRRGPGDEITDMVFRAAAERLRSDGDYDGARAMDAIAAAGGELGNAGLDWRHRYDGRPVTTAEHAAADLLARGQIWPEASGETTGIDGALYSAAGLVSDPGGLLPAVIAIGHAGALEIISGFAGERARDSWLADRLKGRAEAAGGLPDDGPPVPLAGTVTGPDCRARREERVLAWLLQHDGPAGEEFRRLEAHAFTTYGRSEIYLAWQKTAQAADGGAPPPGEVRHELARRMLRAPAWADQAIGWPLGHHALAYHDRLAATPVTASQAESAVRALHQEEAAVLGQARRISGVIARAEPSRKGGPIPVPGSHRTVGMRPGNEPPQTPVPRILLQHGILQRRHPRPRDPARLPQPIRPISLRKRLGPRLLRSPFGHRVNPE